MSATRSCLRRRLASVVLVALPLAALLSACGSGSSSSPAAALSAARAGSGTSSPAAGRGVDCEEIPGAVTGGSTPTDLALPTVTSSAPELGQLGGAELLPTDFPVPPGATVGQVGRLAPVSITVPLTLPDIVMAYDYLKTALPQHGYTITSCSLTPGLAAIGFRGHECVGGDTEAVFSPGSSSVLCALS